jgi:D-lactate dehydrogenase (cytochrome)
MTQSTAVARREAPAALLDALRDRFGDRFTTARSIREHHGKDESHFAPAAPDAVVYPTSTEEVATAVKLCAAHDTPIIAFGAGSSLEGHILAIAGGIAIDLTKMDRLIALNADDLDCVVKAGLTRKTLNALIRDTGLFFPLDPGADATLGGMAATRASGTNAVRYGTMRENVLALTAVLADGSIVKTGTRARKSSAGYDLTKLLIGSEGTLAIITELTLRLHPQPEALSAAVCAFPTVRAAVETVIRTIQLGVPVARCEFLNRDAVRAIVDYSKVAQSKIALVDAPMVFFEFHGSHASVKEQALTVESIATEAGGMGFKWATTQEERTVLWQARHDAYFACLAMRPGGRVLSTDACVPISRLADCIDATEADLAQGTLASIVLGHVGDGNFHVGINLDPNDARQLEAAEAINHRLVERALAMGGTCTGEHGIGMGKIDFLEAEHPSGVPMMRAIKRALDPQNLMNPGKMLRMEYGA